MRYTEGKILSEAETEATTKESDSDAERGRGRASDMVGGSG